MSRVNFTVGQLKKTGLTEAPGPKKPVRQKVNKKAGKLPPLPVKPKIWIGIDPGSTTGLAKWTPELGRLIVKQFKSHAEAILYADSLIADAKVFYGREFIRFRIEDARKAFKSAKFAAENGHSRDQGVGAVKAYSKDWEAFCGLKNVACDMVAPNNRLTKVDAAYFEELTGIKTMKTHSHCRDAGMLVFKM